MIIVREHYDVLWRRLSAHTKAIIRDVAQQRQMSLSAVVLEHADLLPKRLRAKVPKCFAANEVAWLKARHDYHAKMLRSIQRRLRGDA